MSDELWIEVVNWDKFQHYHDRNPNWVKNYTELLHDPNYLELSAGERAILHGLWLEYALSHARVRLSTSTLRARLQLKVSKRQLESLNHAGFIRFVASTPLALRARSREVEKRSTQTKTEEHERQELQERGIKDFDVRRRARENDPDVENLIDELEQLEARWPPWNSTRSD